eukprot:Opistho-2@43865
MGDNLSNTLYFRFTGDSPSSTWPGVRLPRVCPACGVADPAAVAARVSHGVARVPSPSAIMVMPCRVAVQRMQRVSLRSLLSGVHSHVLTDPTAPHSKPQQDEIPAQWMRAKGSVGRIQTSNAKSKNRIFSLTATGAMMHRSLGVQGDFFSTVVQQTKVQFPLACAPNPHVLCVD